MSNMTNNENGCDFVELINLISREKSSVFTVSTLWIILFGLIITQKVFKYVVKPCRNNANNTTNNGGNENGANVQDACIII